MPVFIVKCIAKNGLWLRGHFAIPIDGIPGVAFVQLVGTESSVLCVSNLVGGVYLFELTVTDSIGQIGRTGVIVDVLAGMQRATVT